MINLGRLLMLAAAALPAWLGSHSKEGRTDRMAEHWRKDEKETAAAGRAASESRASEPAEKAAPSGDGREKAS